MADGFKIADAYVEVHLEDKTGPGKTKLYTELRKLQPVKIPVVLDDAGVIRQLKASRTKYSKDAAHAGTFIGEVMGRNWQKSLAGMLGHPYLKGPVFAGIIAGAQVAGTAAGTAFVTKLAFEIQKTNAPVAGAIDQLKKTITAALREDTGGFAPALIRSAEKLGQTFRDLRPQIRDAFVAAAPHVDALTDGVDRLARNAMPGLVDSVRRSAGVTAGLVSLMADAGTGISRFFDEVSQGSQDARTSLEAFGRIIADAGFLVGSVVRDIGGVFAQVSNEFTGVFSSLTNIIVRMVDSGVGPLGVALEIVTAAFGAILNVIEPFSGVLGTALGTVLGATLAIRGLSGAIGILSTAGTMLSGAAISGAFNTFSRQVGNAALVAGQWTEKAGGMMVGADRAAAAGDRVAGTGAKIVGALRSIGNNIPVVGAALIGLAIIYEQVGSKAEELGQKALAGSRSLAQAIAEERNQVENLATAMQFTGSVIAGHILQVNSEAIARHNVTAAIREQYAAMTPLQQKAADVALAEGKYQDMLKQYGPTAEATRHAAGVLAQARQAEAAATHAAELATRTHTQVLIDNMNVMLGVANADLGYRQALHDREKAQRNLNDAIRESGPESEAAKDAALALESADLRVAAAAGRLAEETHATSDANVRAEEAAAATRAAILDLGTASDGRGTPSMRRLADSMSDADLAAHNARVRTSGFAYEVRTLPSGRTVLIQTNADSARVPVLALKSAIAGIPRTVNVRIITNAASAGATLGALGRAKGGIDFPGRIHPFAAGGVAGKASMLSNRHAAVVRPGDFRLIGDNPRVPELFLPLERTKRSLGLLDAAAQHLGQVIVPMSSPSGGGARASAGTSGGPVASAAASAARSGGVRDVHVHVTQTSGSPGETGRFVALALRTVG